MNFANLLLLSTVSMLTENWLGKSGNVCGGWIVVLGNVNNRLLFIFNEIRYFLSAVQVRSARRDEEVDEMVLMLMICYFLSKFSVGKSTSAI